MHSANITNYNYKIFKGKSVDSCTNFDNTPFRINDKIQLKQII